MIGFNKPHISGKEFDFIQEAIRAEKLSGNGEFTKRCHRFFERRYGFEKTLLTNSCTAALEMAAMLMEIGPGDEVIVPSYTFVSSANPFVNAGAKVVFADSNAWNPNIDVNDISRLVTARTKAIVVVHYAGVACDMDPIIDIARSHNILVVEDAAQAIDSYYKGAPLGSIGDLGAMSFHETKNIICGEGGMLIINNQRFIDRSEVIWEKGTNRAAFFRGEVDKYTWIDKGSSFLPSELTAAFLCAQLEALDRIQEKRKAIWNRYYEALRSANLAEVTLPFIDDFATNNGHVFYLVTENVSQRDQLLNFLRRHEIQAIFHYVPLHSSPFFQQLNQRRYPPLPMAERYGDCLIRLPFYVDMSFSDVDEVVDKVICFFKSSF